MGLTQRRNEYMREAFMTVPGTVKTPERELLLSVWVSDLLTMGVFFMFHICGTVKSTIAPNCVSHVNCSLGSP